MLGEKCAREAMEFWWDNINTHKISPPALVSYTDGVGRDLHGRRVVHDDERHPAVRQVQRSRRVQGRREGGEEVLRPQFDQDGARLARGLVLGHPEGDRAEQKKLAKELLTWMGETDEVQRDIFKATAAFRRSRRCSWRWRRRASLRSDEGDPDRRAVPHRAGVLLQAVARGARDVLRRGVEGLIGKREDIPKVLSEGPRSSPRS